MGNKIVPTTRWEINFSLPSTTLWEVAWRSFENVSRILNISYLLMDLLGIFVVEQKKHGLWSRANLRCTKGTLLKAELQ